MLTTKGELVKEPKFLDCSGLACFTCCEVKYCFKSILGLSSDEGSPAMDYGSCLHVAMPSLQRGDLIQAFKDFSESWLAYGHQDDDKRNLQNALKMLTHWYEGRYVSGVRPYKIIEPPTTNVEPETRYSDQEFAFCVDVNGPLPFAGRVDALGRSTSDNSLCVIEYKTTSELGSRVLGSFDINSQIIGYTVASSLFTHEEIVGLVYLELLRVSKTNPEDLCAPLFIPHHMMDAWIENFKSVSQRIVKCFETGKWQHDYTGCAPYVRHGVHGYQCEYAPLCHSEDWRVMRDMFKVKYWQPFKELIKETNHEG